MVMRLKLIGLVLLTSTTITPKSLASGTPGEWDKPALALAEQIADMLGPGQAQLTVRNLSSILAAEMPSIRKLLEQDLKANGVLASGAESANAIRITLSESARERVWVAEVVEGNQVRVAMAHFDFAAAPISTGESRVVLRKEKLRGVIPSDEPILFATELKGTILILHVGNISELASPEFGWKERMRFSLGRGTNQTKDPRGILLLSGNAEGFKAFAPGTICTGAYSNSPDGSADSREFTVHCQDSDDPWPILGASDANDAHNLRAFFNRTRNYFTGVVTPSVGVDLPSFYSAALLPRPASGMALLLISIDGKVQIVENSELRTVAGTRDWGSDFAVLHSGCGAGAQVVASGSGEAVSDSLRAYEIPSLEALPVSAPIAMDGTVTAMWPATDGKSIFAVVRSAANQYEVDRVTALCN